MKEFGTAGFFFFKYLLPLLFCWGLGVNAVIAAELNRICCLSATGWGWEFKCSYAFTFSSVDLLLDETRRCSERYLRSQYLESQAWRGNLHSPRD